MVIVLGAGVSGLAVGMASGAPVFEAASGPGGLCSSYYLRPDGSERLERPPADGEAYRFELGGGHSIFGGDPDVLARLDTLAPSERYERRATIDLGGDTPLVAYPIQAHLDALAPDLARRAADELRGSSDLRASARTMQEWLVASFGPSLCEAFFFPFHERYTAGLYESIAPQDVDKSPTPAGAAQDAPIGYNPTFAYPRQGLDALVHTMADTCDVRVRAPRRCHRSGRARGRVRGRHEHRVPRAGVDAPVGRRGAADRSGPGRRTRSPHLGPGAQHRR